METSSHHSMTEKKFTGHRGIKKTVREKKWTTERHNSNRALLQTQIHITRPKMVADGTTEGGTSKQGERRCRKAYDEDCGLRMVFYWGGSRGSGRGGGKRRTE